MPANHENKEQALEKKLLQIQAENRILKKKLSLYEFCFYAKESLIKGAGVGLFTSSKIPSGSIIGEYTGIKVWRMTIPKTKRYVVWSIDKNNRPKFHLSDTYILWFEDEEYSVDETGHYTDKNNCDENVSPIIEDGIDGSENTNSLLWRSNSSDTPNSTILVTHDRKAFAIAMEDISPEQEICWDYNPGTEKDFSVPPDAVENDYNRYITIDENGQVHLKHQNKTINTER